MGYWTFGADSGRIWNEGQMPGAAPVPGGNGDPSMPNNQSQSGTIGDAGSPSGGGGMGMTRPGEGGGGLDTMGPDAGPSAPYGGGQGAGTPSGGGGWAPGGGLQQYPDSANTYGQSNMNIGGGSSGGQLMPGRGSVGGNQPIGSTVQGPSNTGSIGGQMVPGNPNDMIANAKPFQGGPQGMMTMAGFKSGGTGPMPQDAYNRYQGMLQDPTSMSANPAYKAIMDASLQATQRAQLAHGGNGGGTMAAELARTGASVAGQYLPQMANMYQGGAQQEAGNWQMQNQANLGYGNLGSNMYANTAQDQLNRANAYNTSTLVNAGAIGASQAQQQMNPANQYYQNQLTMQNYR